MKGKGSRTAPVFSSAAIRLAADCRTAATGRSKLSSALPSIVIATNPLPSRASKTDARRSFSERPFGASIEDLTNARSESLDNREILVHQNELTRVDLDAEESTAGG